MFAPRRRQKSRSKIQPSTSCKPQLEALEDRTVPSGFSDSFEGGALNPFWSTIEHSGAVSLSSSRAHSGQQSVEMVSTQGSEQKGIYITHSFPEPVYGKVSVWLYDNGAGVDSSNYMAIAVSDDQGHGAGLLTFDYDLGPSNGGSYYYYPFEIYQSFNTGVVRSQAWHQFSINSTPSAVTVQIDGLTVRQTDGGHPLTEVDIGTSGPWWRPAWTGYFDDFEFTPYGQPDVRPTELNWNSTEGGVDFSYQVTGDDLSRDTTAALSWADDNHNILSAAQANPIPIVAPRGNDQTIHIDAADLTAPPLGATQLLLVVDPPDVGHAHGLIEESDEGNNERSLAIPDIALLHVSTQNSRQVTFDYEIRGAPISQFQLDFFRSPTKDFDPARARFITSKIETNASPGQHTDAAPVLLTIDPSRPYVIAVADPLNTVIETNEANNQGSFRKRVLGVVTHGFGFATLTRLDFPGWITDMAASLRNEARYDRSVAFEWDATRPIPGRAEQAGRDLARRVDLEIQQMKALWPDDVIDVHLIGHSRGAVVISQALQNLVGNTELEKGFTKMTMLDPHPARNRFLDPQYSVIDVPGPLGQIGRALERTLILYQAMVNDRDVFVPRNVDQSEDFFQHTPWFATGTLAGTFLNLWGENNILDLSGQGVRYVDLTQVGMDHSRVHEWYQRFIVPTLNDGASAAAAPRISVLFNDAFAPADLSQLPGQPSPPSPPNAGRQTDHLNHLYAILSRAQGDRDWFFADLDSMSGDRIGRLRLRGAS